LTNNSSKEIKQLSLKLRVALTLAIETKPITPVSKRDKINWITNSVLYQVREKIKDVQPSSVVSGSTIYSWLKKVVNPAPKGRIFILHFLISAFFPDIYQNQKTQSLSSDPSEFVKGIDILDVDVSELLDASDAFQNLTAEVQAKINQSIEMVNNAGQEKETPGSNPNNHQNNELDAKRNTLIIYNNTEKKHELNNALEKLKKLVAKGDGSGQERILPKLMYLSYESSKSWEKLIAHEKYFLYENCKKNVIDIVKRQAWESIDKENDHVLLIFGAGAFDKDIAVIESLNALIEKANHKLYLIWVDLSLHMVNMTIEAIIKEYPNKEKIIELIDNRSFVIIDDFESPKYIKSHIENYNKNLINLPITLVFLGSTVSNIHQELDFLEKITTHNLLKNGDRLLLTVEFIPEDIEVKEHPKSTVSQINNQKIKNERLRSYLKLLYLRYSSEGARELISTVMKDSKDEKSLLDNFDIELTTSRKPFTYYEEEEHDYLKCSFTVKRPNTSDEGLHTFIVTRHKKIPYEGSLDKKGWKILETIKKDIPLEPYDLNTNESANPGLPKASVVTWLLKYQKPEES
jgi:uncharacterized SAM-dependent methyltransferase